MNKTKLKQKYFTPEFYQTELKAEDVLLSSNIEQRSEVIIENGDWSESLLGFMAEEIG